MLKAFIIGNSCVTTAKKQDSENLFSYFNENLDIHNIVIKSITDIEPSTFSLTIINIHLLKQSYIKLFDLIYKKMKEGDVSYIKSMLIPSYYTDNFLTRIFLEHRIIAKSCKSIEHVYSVENNTCINSVDQLNIIKEIIITDIINDNYFDNSRAPFISHFNNILISITEFECELAMFLIKESLELWIKERQKSDQYTMNIIKENIYKIVTELYKNDSYLSSTPC